MDKKRTVLVLGTNAGQLDLIKHMQECGWYVVSCSHRAGEPGEAVADEFHLIDIRDVEGVVSLARQVDAALVFSVSSDIAITTATKVSEILLLPHFFDSALIDLFNNKQQLREFLNERGLSEVNFKAVKALSELTDLNDFPCVVKPSDAQGQRGVQKVNNKAELLEAVDEAIKFSSTGTAIVEDYLDGVELSCNFLINNGEILFRIVSERLVYGDQLMGVPKGHLIPCVNISDEVLIQAEKLTEDVVSALKITNGSLYFQMKATSRGVKIIEIAPRLDGCHMWRLIKHVTGESFLAATVSSLLDEQVSANLVTRAVGSGGYELMFQQTPPGERFSADKFLTKDNVEYHEFRYLDGDVVLPVNGKMEVVGYYIRKINDQELTHYQVG